MKVRKLTPADSALWQGFVEKTTASNLCHNLAWRTVLTETFGHTAHYLLVEDQGKVRGVLPLIFVKSFLFGKGLISLPYLNAGGVLADCSEAEILLQQAAIDLLKDLGADYLELRLSAPSNNSLGLTLRQHKVSFVLDLPTNSAELFKSFPAKLRSQINRPLKSAAQFKIIAGDQISAKDLAEFYQIFSRHNRDLGTPSYPANLFENVVKNFQAQVLLASVELAGHKTSAALVVKQKGVAEIIWAASLKEYHSDSVNMLLYWGTLAELCQQGVQEFDFGRASYNSGGYRFKKQWGGRELPLYWYYYGKEKCIPDVNPKSGKFSMATRVWQYLPLACAQRLGAILTKHLP